MGEAGYWALLWNSGSLGPVVATQVPTLVAGATPTLSPSLQRQMSRVACVASELGIYINLWVLSCPIQWPVHPAPPQERFAVSLDGETFSG